MRPGVRLGVDVGSVRVGLAASDPSGVVASPVQTLARDSAQGSDVTAIVGEARERGAVEVVVGLPLSLSGEEGKAALLARRYAQRLSAALAPTPVRLVDERLTTVSAHQAMAAAGRPGRRQREVVDQVAAVILLQAALDRERSTGEPLGDAVAAAPAPLEPPALGPGASEPVQEIGRRPRKPRRRGTGSAQDGAAPGSAEAPGPDRNPDRHGGPAADDHGRSVETPWTA